MKLLTFILARMIKKIAPFGAALALGLFLIAAPVAHASTASDFQAMVQKVLAQYYSNLGAAAVTSTNTGGTETNKISGSLVVDSVPTTSAVVTKMGSGSQQEGTFTFTFNATAVGGQDVYLSSTTYAFAPNVVFDQNNVATATASSAMTSTATRTPNGNYVIHAGQTVSITIVFVKLGQGGYVHAKLAALRYGTTDLHPALSVLTLPANYVTQSVFLNGPAGSGSPTCSVSSSGTSVFPNQSFTVTWNSTNANTMTGIPGKDAWAPNGSLPISIGTPGTYTYTLLFHGNGGQTATCVVTEYVSGHESIDQNSLTQLVNAPFVMTGSTNDYVEAVLVGPNYTGKTDWNTVGQLLKSGGAVGTRESLDTGTGKWTGAFGGVSTPGTYMVLIYDYMGNLLQQGTLVALPNQKG